MANNLISNQRPAGIALFSGFESFVRDLSEDDESVIAGGGRSNSNSNSGRRKNRRRKNRRKGRGGRSRT